MKQWNSHAWYCVAILAALLIGTLSVKWNTVDRLPEIIGFAVGLSSLILSLFTIIQSISGGNYAEATLGAVKEGAQDLRDTASDIALVARDLKEMSASMLASNERNYTAVSDIANQLKSKRAPAQAGEGDESAAIKGLMTVGGGPALIAVALSKKTGIPFKLSEIFPKDSSTSYESGFIGGLEASGFIKTKYDSGTYSVLDTVFSPDVLIDEAKKRKFRPDTQDSRYRDRISVVEKFFSAANEGDEA